MIFHLFRHKRIILLLVLLATSFSLFASGQSYFIRGIIRDANTDEAIAAAFINVNEYNLGTMSDENGIFEITVPTETKNLSIKCQGYEPQTIPINKNNINLYAIYLVPEPTILGEVVVKKQKYSKKNNPAVDLMQHIRATSESNNPENAPYYSYKTYQRVSIALNNIKPSEENSIIAKFPFLIEHIDTSEISGKPILPISVREQSSETYLRKFPRDKQIIITGKRNEGIDEMLDAESMNTLVNDVLGPVDIYARDINILDNRFVSPLSPIASDFYKFYITDSLTKADGRKYYILSFYPHNKSTFGFNGRLEVSITDSTAFVRSVQMRVPSEINLNFIETLSITQVFDESVNGMRIPLRDDMTIEAAVIPGTQGFYARRIIDYSDHNFEKPNNESEIFKSRISISTLSNASRRDSTFWTIVNPSGLSRGEKGASQLMSRFRQNKVFYWSEQVLKVLVKGYITTRSQDSKFNFGPVNTTISANPLEGARFRVGGITTAALSPHFFARIYGAYGTKDHRWKYGLELEYSFNKKEHHSREFPVHSFRFNSTYDVFRPGQQYAFTNPDNVFLSLHRPGIDPMTYHRLNSLLYTLELQNNFSVKATLANDCLYKSPQLNFILSENGNSINHFTLNSAEIELRYAPGEKFYQTTTNRIPINQDNPVITLTHKFAPKGLGNFSTVNSTRLSYMQRFWFSSFGYLDVIAKTGHVWSERTPFNNLLIANTNLSYTIQPESFALTAPMELVSDSYGDLELTYWANGALLNYVPLIKKLKLREVFSIHGYYGALSPGNDPAKTPGLIEWPGCYSTSQRLHTPYIEASVGLDNICRILRVDYVWRITHRGNPIEGGQRWGIRIALHFTF